jgi:hypothetical protein
MALHNTLTRRMVLLAVGLGGLATGAWAVLGRLAVQQSYVPPLELVKLGTIVGTASKAVSKDLKLSWYDWDTLQQSVTVKRRERQTMSSLWDQQVQDLSTSYYVLDVRWTCGIGDEIKRLYLAGVYPDGDACIEEWTFKYTIQNTGGYVPISQRAPPVVKRKELLRTSLYGRIRSLEPDPDGRYLLFSTYENPTLYRLPLPTGAVQVELAQTTIPELSGAKSITIRHHATEGRVAVLSQDPRWHADLLVPRNIIVLYDSDNDSTFETHVVLDLSDWTALGYDDPAVWTYTFCP